MPYLIFHLILSPINLKVYKNTKKTKNQKIKKGVAV